MERSRDNPLPDGKRPPSKADIIKAAGRIEGCIHRTPVMTCSSIDSMLSAKLFFKCENLQKVGAFKIRGASNAVLSLTDGEARSGVATHSSGNHAQALSLAAKERGIPAYIVMPSNSPRVKVDAVKGYGGIITFCEPTLAARESTLAEVVRRTGAHFVHPYDDPRIIAGQATAALELLQEINDLDIVMAPVGGGGLISGTSLSVRFFSKGTRVVGAEPELANDAQISLRTGALQPPLPPLTVADGLRTALSPLTFSVIRDNVTDIITVSEEGIIKAMKLLWERTKMVIEPSAAVPLGALLEGNLDVHGRRVGIILSGGNVDLDLLPWMRR